MFRMIKEISEMLDAIKQGLELAVEDGTIDMMIEMDEFLERYDSQIKD